jgi:hypothetical protein
VLARICATVGASDAASCLAGCTGNNSANTGETRTGRTLQFTIFFVALTTCILAMTAAAGQGL